MSRTYFIFTEFVRYSAAGCIHFLTLCRAKIVIFLEGDLYYTNVFSGNLLDGRAENAHTHTHTITQNGPLG